jgi:hypothetical protein
VSNVLKETLCPSAPASEGSLIIGIVGANGIVSYIRDRMEVTTSFLDSARLSGTPERRFRFSSPCQQRACAQWTNGSCALPSQLAAFVPVGELAESLPRCSIRQQCRWFIQSGARACRICPTVSTQGETSAGASYTTVASTK